MIIEVFYLWRALPFCSEDIKLQMMEMLDLALPPDALPFHKAMRAWLRGGVLNSLGRPNEAEKVSQILNWSCDCHVTLLIIGKWSCDYYVTVHIGEIIM